MATAPDLSLELAQRSLDAIDKITNQANFHLTILAVIIGVAAISGWAMLQNGAMKVAKEISEERLKAFLASEEGRSFIRQAIAEEVNARIQDKSFGDVKPLGDDETTEPFPSAPSDGKPGGEA